jgi:hypothetical protein
MPKNSTPKRDWSNAISRGPGSRFPVLAAVGLLLLVAVPAAVSAKNTASTQDNGTGGHLNQDAKHAVADIKEGAHRVGVAAKAVAHEVATAAKRSAAETRRAMRGEKVDTGGTNRSH